MAVCSINSPSAVVPVESVTSPSPNARLPPLIDRVCQRKEDNVTPGRIPPQSIITSAVFKLPLGSTIAGKLPCESKIDCLKLPAVVTPTLIN